MWKKCETKILHLKTHRTNAFVLHCSIFTSCLVSTETNTKWTKGTSYMWVNVQFQKKKESKYCTKFLCCLQACVKWCCFSLDLIQIIVSLPRNPFFLHSIFTRLVAIFLIPDQFVISKRLNINCLREPYVFITAVVSICIIRNTISISIAKFCHMFYILHVFSLESRIKMCKMYTAFQVFFANVQCYSAECSIV